MKAIEGRQGSSKGKGQGKGKGQSYFEIGSVIGSWQEESTSSE